MNEKRYRIYFAEDLQGPYRPVPVAEEITFEKEEAKIFERALLCGGFAVMLREAEPINCKEDEP